MAASYTFKKLMASAVALTVLFGGAATTLPVKPVSAAEATVTASSKASSIIALGKRYMGVKYKFGAKTGNTSSFDCSSFTQYLYGKYGVHLPRESKAQSKSGRYVSKSNLQPGDLVFFYSPIHHVGIYIGGGKVIHTYGSPGVTISSINSGWWKDHYTTARRVL
ncbi:C40 family peptidase [Cohnella rhizosphaerae]|uniref:C40 family peptidase n=1 Tax=Cohnella rhizosphaerae TaxID=1457232 RepID=A0A9X4KXX0_9BACL|nr:C40 family peptidase [Cohnella rhizosphaerae]MDG0812897.1 C40 family peptidase [Cohnella rhizosphaerae]